MAKMTDEYRRDTRLVRAGLERSQFQETSEAMFLNSGYVYDSAEEAAAFAGRADRFVYSRYGNPTVSMLQARLAALEGGRDLPCDRHRHGGGLRRACLPARLG